MLNKIILLCQKKQVKKLKISSFWRIISPPQKNHRAFNCRWLWAEVRLVCVALLHKSKSSAALKFLPDSPLL